MPRYEILFHAVCDIACDSAEDAAVMVRTQMLGLASDQAQVRHLAVWRDDPEAAVSPLDSDARAQLDAFFTAVQRCANQAEDQFRHDVEAILLAMPARDEIAAPAYTEKE